MNHFSKTDHPNYSNSTFQYDFSILQLSGSVNFADLSLSHVSPICWPIAKAAVGADVSGNQAI
jgi:hypothetical protein